MRKLIPQLLSLLLFLMNCSVKAEVPKWQVVPDKSSIKFFATQNNAPVGGQFKKFTGEIAFDPKQLKDSHIKLMVDMNSVSSGFQELTDMLKTMSWFDTTKFSQAKFESQNINQKDPGTLEVKGTLTLKDKAEPIIAEVVLDESTVDHIRLHGQTILKRSAFGVGLGEWSATSEVKDEVTVKFILELQPRSR
ncbi:MAG: YceI family protein [Proteobacteria bacterium]|nr:YceI family protein [Pseudomonadota bacterium]